MAISINFRVTINVNNTKPDELVKLIGACKKHRLTLFIKDSRIVIDRKYSIPLELLNLDVNIPKEVNKYFDKYEHKRDWKELYDFLCKKDHQHLTIKYPAGVNFDTTQIKIEFLLHQLKTNTHGKNYYVFLEELTYIYTKHLTGSIPIPTPWYALSIEERDHYAKEIEELALLRHRSLNPLYLGYKEILERMVITNHVYDISMTRIST